MRVSKKYTEQIVQIIRNFGDEGITVPDAYYIGYKLLAHFSIYNPFLLEFNTEDRLITGSDVYLNCVKKHDYDGEEKFFFIIRTHKEELVSCTPCVFDAPCVL